MRNSTAFKDSLELDDESNPSSVLPTGQGPSMNDPTSADQGLLNLDDRLGL